MRPVQHDEEALPVPDTMKLEHAIHSQNFGLSLFCSESPINSSTEQNIHNDC